MSWLRSFWKSEQKMPQACICISFSLSSLCQRFTKQLTITSLSNSVQLFSIQSIFTQIVCAALTSNCSVVHPFACTQQAANH